ncbi:hypothetical protein [Halomonas icarae]|uniref:Uncharacterized protein n=1 Tax=Halomonas icarae TaxID=2691040 RepID=A0A7X5AM95_9GAMM|nr:hypothetical protein [Halomonas icarae]MDR5902986.1 hypothetical protein [Halomonas icarae]NAW13561.1 hypothetical protein [Halomonas icarae]
MTTSKTTSTSTSRQPWWVRLSERCYTASTAQLVRDVQHEAGSTYDELLTDLKSPLEPGFERQVARRLQSDKPIGFKPARTLMPVMMQRFSLQDAELTNDPDYGAMRATCNGCPVVGRCWKAMRGGADVEECRGFCPNAEAFDSRAAQ